MAVSKNVRARVYVRDNWTCQYCGRQFDPDVTWSDKSWQAPFADDDGDYVFLEVDHIMPRKHGGGDHLENLRAACTPCNKRKSAWVRDEEWNFRFRAARSVFDQSEPSQTAAERIIGELLGRPFKLKEVGGSAMVPGRRSTAPPPEGFGGGERSNGLVGTGGSVVDAKPN